VINDAFRALVSFWFFFGAELNTLAGIGEPTPEILGSPTFSVDLYGFVKFEV
jgi:hypothetical protein